MALRLNAKPATPPLSVCIIARDEANHIGACLDSLAPLVAAGAEIVLVDTGSTDATVLYAHNKGVRARHYTWSDDFAAARNETLRWAQGAWVLSIDADERLSPETCAAILAAIKGPPRFLDLRIENDMGEAGKTRHHGRRLFPRDGVRWDGIIHEVPVSSTPLPGEVLPNAVILHLGYSPQDMALKDKAVRNVNLLVESVRRKPGCPLLRLYLVESLIAAEAWHDAADQARACLWLSLTTEGSDAGRLYDQAAIYLVEVCALHMDPELAMRESQAIRRRRDPEHAGFWYVLGCVQQMLGVRDEHSPTLFAALGSFNRAIALAHLPVLQEDAAVTSWKPWRGLAATYLILGNEVLAQMHEERARQLGAPKEA